MLAFLMILTSCGGEAHDTESDTPDAQISDTQSDTETETETDRPDPETGVVKTLDVKWNFGAIPSYSNLNGTSTIMESFELYSYTDIITIPYAGTKITFTDSAKGFATADFYAISLWAQKDGKWVPDGDGMCFTANGIANNTVCKYDSGKVIYTYVTHKDNENIRLCYRSEQTVTSTPEFPEVTAVHTGEDSSYTLYMAANKEFYDWLAENKKTAYDNTLEGLTMNIIGDSYFAGDGIQKNQVWPALIAEKYGMNFVNHGIGGSTMTNFVTYKNPMVERYTKLPDNDPDIVILEGGRNDFNQSVPIGRNTDTTTTTFKGALNTLIDGLREKYPKAMIICVTVWENGTATNSIGNVCSDYGRAMQEICRLKDVPCHNSMDQKATGVYMTDAVFRAKYCIKSTDISHLNVKGMMKVMPVFEEFITDQWAIFTGRAEKPADTDENNTVVTGTELSLKWNHGYVASVYNKSNANQRIMNGAALYSYTDVFTVPKAGTKITFLDPAGHASNNAYVFSLWKKDGEEWVLDNSQMHFAGNGSNDSVIQNMSTAGVTYTYVTHKDNENLRICYHSGQKAGVTPEYLTVYYEVTGEQSSYSAFLLENKEFYNWLEANKKETYYSSLEGLTLNALGDSYFDGNNGIPDRYQVWPGILAQKYGMDFVNHGIGGSTMSNFVTNKNPMVDRYQKLYDNDPDIIIVEGGRNDFNVAAPIGTNDSRDTKTFKGALNTVLDGLQAKYPDAMIVCVTVWYWEQSPKAATGGTHLDYGNAMLEVCAERGIPCFNSMDVETVKVDMMNGAFRAKYCASASDGSHLNLEGMKLALPAFEKFIAEQWELFNKK